MQNKIIVFCDNQNTTSNALKEIEISLLKRGLFDFSFLSCSLYADCLAFCHDAKNEGNVIVVCKNEDIDKLVEAVKTDTDNLTLVDEQAVKLEQTTTFGKILFVPIEIGVEKFLDGFVEKKNVYSCSIFGKNHTFVQNFFSEIKEHEVGFNYEIITKSQFLHTIYYSKHIDENVLNEKFGESVFAFDERSLQKCCADVLKEKSLSLSVADALTMGEISCRISLADEKVSLKEDLVLPNEDAFAKLDIEKAFLAEHGSVSKETVFVMSKNLLKDSVDLSLSVVGFDVDAGRCFVAVGNRQEIHVFSSLFYGSKQQRMENVTDFALFRLLRFLKEKY